MGKTEYRSCPFLLLPSHLKSRAIKTPEKKFSLLETSTMMYTVMAAVGAGICIWGHNNLESLMAFPLDNAILTKFLGIAALGTGVLLTGSFVFESWFDGFAGIRKSMMVLLKDTGPFGAMYLALLSAVGEELLFRGAIQPAAGIYVTSILFGLLHLGPQGAISAWSFWAMLSGLLLGQIVVSTGSLIPAIAIHFAVNLTSFTLLRRDWRRLSDSDKEALLAASRMDENGSDGGDQGGDDKEANNKRNRVL